jgi:hypothetical protein
MFGIFLLAGWKIIIHPQILRELANFSDASKDFHRHFHSPELGGQAVPANQELAKQAFSPEV